MDGFCLFGASKNKKVLSKIINHFYSFLCSNTREPAWSLAQHKSGDLEMRRGIPSSKE